MDSSAMAWTAIKLAVVFLSLTFAPNWCLVFVILLGMIKRKYRTLPVFAQNGCPALPGNPPPPAGGAPPPAGGSPPPPGGVPIGASDASASASVGGAPPPAGGAPPPAGGSPPPPGGAPIGAGDALASAVDASSPAGMKRRKPEVSSTSSSLSSNHYEVFLSFRGEDTRRNFVDGLYSRLEERGIKVFKEGVDLLSREEINLARKEGIRQSRVSMPIFSKNYASGKSCLMELQQMLAQRELNRQTIIPIFYDVSPHDVKYQAGDFGRSFSLHEIDRVDSNTIEKWREALRQVAKLKGYDRENMYEGHNGRLVEAVVANVACLLELDDQVVTDELVGIDFEAEQVTGKLGVAYSEGQVQGKEVCFLVIHGMGGIGKTTLAKIVYNKVHKLFEASSFLENISSEGLLFLQRKLIADLQKQIPPPLESSREGIEEIASICRKKMVLLVLDDVGDAEQIGALAGSHTWFGQGSRIIVTTRRKDLLTAFDLGAGDRGTVIGHEVNPMSFDHALQLFYKHAFRGDTPPVVSEYYLLSKGIVKALEGLPSAIVLHATSLRHNRNIDRWKTTLDLLQKHPKRWPAPLPISYAKESELENPIEDDQLTSPVQDSSFN